MNSSIRCIIVLLLLKICTANHTESLSSSSIHEREKRWLTFSPNGGVAKLVIGALFPVMFSHNKLVRNLNLAFNLQANYAIPSTIIWPVPESFFKQRLNSDFVDASRGQLYQLLESMFETSGTTSGRECLLRSICEVAETPLYHNGMFGELLDVVLTPYKTDQIDETYKQARLNGLNGVNCEDTYKRCPIGFGLLEKMSVLHLL